MSSGISAPTGHPKPAPAGAFVSQLQRPPSGDHPVLAYVLRAVRAAVRHTERVEMEHPEPAQSRSLADLGGHPVDDHSPALIVLGARQLEQADIEDLVRRGAEDRDLLDCDGSAVEVVFTVAGEPGPWVWRFRLDDEDLSAAELGEQLASELTWRLVEWRDTREQRRPSAAPRLLRAS
jgi:hypothetical protein